MKLSKKLFLSIFLISILICTSSLMLFYFVLKKNIEKEYIARYHSLGMMISDTFNQLEALTDKLNNNAAQALSLIEKEKGLPSNEELVRLRDQLGISSFHVANSNGTIIRTTDLSPPLLAENLFNFCGDYRLLINGNKVLYVTPIVPDSFYNTPSKFILIPSHNRKLIFESGTQLPYIGKILTHVLSNDKNIKSIGFYAPSGAELGFISRLGVYSDGAKKIKLNPTLSEKMNKNEFFFNIKIATTEKYCCECVNKKIATASGEYFYIVRLEVSRDSLVESIHYLRNKIFLILIAAYLLSLLIAKHLAVKLVSRIEKINKTANEIIKSNNLDLRVGVEGIDDEISELANTFNEMIKFLKESQAALVRSEKKISLLDLAAKVSHDIHSPLIAMDMALQQLSKNVPKNHVMILAQGIQSVRDIANNMLNHYRNQDDEQELAFQRKMDDSNVVRPILLSSLAEMMISQKRHEWYQDPCELTLTTKSEATFCWVEVVPNEVKRLLSNLLNNAYDALLVKKQGSIHIMISIFNDTLYMQIHDNGIGIHPDKISDVLNGVSTKHAGKGLGISSAKHYMEKISGKLEIESMINHGTTINLSFLCANNPVWFPEKISLCGRTTVAVLDDDFSMLMYWQNRINDIGLSIKLFSSYDKILEWVKDHHELISSTIFLVDYELAEKETNGLIFLKKINVNNSYLITSHANEFNIQKEVEKAGVWLIPKSLVTKMALV